MKTPVIPFCAFIVVTSLAIAADKPPEYLQFFDPAKGFKPAQPNLTNCYLQAAASLEHFGSPEPYLRHMLAEHERIHRLVRAKRGDSAVSSRPAHMTDAYIEKLATNWNKLSPALSLDQLARDIGDNSRNAIRGVWEDGTLLVTVFSKHHEQVLEVMTGKATTPVGFTQLKESVKALVEYDNPKVDMKGYNVDRRDPVSYALIIRGILNGWRAKLEKTLPPAQSKQMTEAIEGVFLEMALMAHSELEAGILEWSLK